MRKGGCLTRANSQRFFLKRLHVSPRNLGKPVVDEFGAGDGNCDEVHQLFRDDKLITIHLDKRGGRGQCRAFVAIHETLSGRQAKQVVRCKIGEVSLGTSAEYMSRCVLIVQLPDSVAEETEVAANKYIQNHQY